MCSHTYDKENGSKLFILKYYSIQWRHPSIVSSLKIIHAFLATLSFVMSMLLRIILKPYKYCTIFSSNIILKSYFPKSIILKSVALINLRAPVDCVIYWITSSHFNKCFLAEFANSRLFHDLSSLAVYKKKNYKRSLVL